VSRLLARTTRRRSSPRPSRKAAAGGRNAVQWYLLEVGERIGLELGGLVEVYGSSFVGICDSWGEGFPRSSESLGRQEC